MAYIANRPVRFDRDYAIGEVIPESVIDPKMTKRLVDMGKIICADIPAGSGAGDEPTTEESTADGAEKPKRKNCCGREDSRKGKKTGCREAPTAVVSNMV